jgi:hypothetical protein
LRRLDTNLLMRIASEVKSAARPAVTKPNRRVTEKYVHPQITVLRKRSLPCEEALRSHHGHFKSALAESIAVSGRLNLYFTTPFTIIDAGTSTARYCLPRRTRWERRRGLSGL